MSLTIDRALLVRAFLGLGIILGIAIVAGIVLREPIEALADLLLGRAGAAGLFAAVVFTDASPIPMTHEPVLLLAVAQGMEPWRIAGVASAASVFAGPVGWLGGTIVAHLPWADRWARGRGAPMVAFLQRWGAWGVALAALLPIPYALATWTAGVVGLSFPRLLAASLLRIPKTLFYLGLIVGGWQLGA